MLGFSVVRATSRNLFAADVAHMAALLADVVIAGEASDEHRQIVVWRRLTVRSRSAPSAALVMTDADLQDPTLVAASGMRSRKAQTK